MKLWLALAAIIFLLIFLINCAYKSRLKSVYISDLELQIRYLQQYNERIREQFEDLIRQDLSV
ncbi:MAG: hypothetical protein PHO91_02290 [Patescibacteria group bacterium]|nr:hypothetical protein [Patescibacteria group bacterium]